MKLLNNQERETVETLLDILKWGTVQRTVTNLQYPSVHQTSIWSEQEIDKIKEQILNIITN